MINISPNISHLWSFQVFQSESTSRMDEKPPHLEVPSKLSRLQTPFSDVVEELHAVLAEKKAAKDEDDVEDEKETEIEYFDEFRCESTDSGWDTDLEDEADSKKAAHDRTGENVYLRTCKALNIIPSKHLIRSFRKPVFNARHRALGPKEIKSIADALLGNTFVKILDLEDNNLGNGGISQVLRLLLENCFITEVSLAENNLGSRGADVFSDIFKYTRTLTKVNLSGNRFGDKDCSKIAEGIEENDTVKMLSLSHNEFRCAAGINLGIAISNNITLTELDLSWNHLRMEGAVALANGMAKNVAIATLSLRFNGFSDIGAKAMGNALLHNSTLLSLDLSHNRISDHGAISLSHGLAKNTALQSLNISYNPIIKKGGIALLTAAKEAKELIELLMDEIFLDTLAIDILHEILRTRSNLNITYSGVVKGSDADGHKNELDILKRKIFNRIREYLKLNRLRMVDLFNRWDKDKNLQLDKKEFEIGIASANIPLSPEMIDFLMDVLDSDKNGKVEYDEFVAISGIE